MSAEQIEEAVAEVIEAAEGWPERGGHTSKVTATLSVRAGEALDATCDLTGEDKTAIVNKALMRNFRLEAAIDCGGAVYVREVVGGELERVVFW